MPLQLVTTDGKTYSLQHYELAPLNTHDVRVRVKFAAPKHGTETHLLGGSVFDRKRWDDELRIFLPQPEANEAIPPTARSVGNMVVGEVSEVGTGVSRFSVGDAVFGYGPVGEVHQAPESEWFHRNGLSAPDAVCVDPAHVAFVAVRDGNIRIGDDVAIFGLGAIGLMAVQIARAGGARRIFAIDPMSNRRAFAQSHGANAAFDPTSCDVALEIKRATGNKGVDVSVETSGNSRALHEAIRCIRQCGTVVHVPWGPKDGTHLHLNEEFHLNRPTLIGSQAVWDNPDRSHPLWDKGRAYQTTIDLFAHGAVTGDGVVTPIIGFEEAPQRMSELFHQPETAIKVGVSFQ